MTIKKNAAIFAAFFWIYHLKKFKSAAVWSARYLIARPQRNTKPTRNSVRNQSLFPGLHCFVASHFHFKEVTSVKFNFFQKKYW